MAAGDVCAERQRPEADRLAIPEPMVDAHLRIPDDPDPLEDPQRQGALGAVHAFQQAPLAARARIGQTKAGRLEVQTTAAGRREEIV